MSLAASRTATSDGHTSASAERTSHTPQGGANVRVTEQNKHEYVERFCRRQLVHGADDAIKALAHGLTDVVPARWLASLSA